MPPRKDLGSLLVDEDVLDPKDLERVRDVQPLWAALIDRELATPEQIFRALSARFGVPVVADERLSDVSVPDKLRRVITRAEALQIGLLPVDLSADGQRATVVMVDPSDEPALAQFLTRAKVPEGRALLGRRDPLLRAIDRCLAGLDTAVVSPLPPPRRPPAPPPTPPPRAAMRPVGEDDVTGTVTLDATGSVKIDPDLEAEIAKLPPRAREAEPLTPLPTRPRAKRPTPPPASPPLDELRAPARASMPSPPTATFDEARGPETPSEALRAEERLTRALIEMVEALALELEARLGVTPLGAEMARLSRRVSRQLNLPRRAADEIGAAAQLFAVDRALRAAEGATAPDVFAALGWTAAGDGGILPTLRALTAASSGFARGAAGQPLGARIIGAVADYLELGAASHAPDLDTVSQLLRASPAGSQVVDALLRVLQDERGDITPAEPTTLPATSVLKHVDEAAVTPQPQEAEPANDTPLPLLSDVSDRDKTMRRPMPRKQTHKKSDEKGE